MPLATFVHDGAAIDFRPSSDVAAGDVVVLDQLVGVARTSIKANTLGSLAVQGVFDVPKGPGVIPAGAQLFWDAGAKAAQTSSGSGTYPRLGNAVALALLNDATVRVRLNTGFPEYQALPVP
ncbi:MAG: DUF2190 family protein [Phycisphaerae bacterium]|jgi:predicted RecA/RadA family phage recombinase|nr:DUF2190 family protein [Phycisphaerae bacterium]MCZ2399294.1 DUF2190 family protein [Phycisphaerae bacterium]NUQ48551.1 DUF2190 family protein [Phycisphaerae bacterium]